MYQGTHLSSYTRREKHFTGNSTRQGKRKKAAGNQVNMIGLKRLQESFFISWGVTITDVTLMYFRWSR